MFVAVFVLAFVTAHVTALVRRDVPSYFNVCGRKDPKVNECIKDNIENLRPKICKGFSDLEIPSNDPMRIKEIVIANTDSAKLYLKDADVIGLCAYILDDVHADVDKLHFEIKFSFEHLSLNSTYDFNLRVLVPIAIDGKAFIIADEVKANVDFDLTKVTRNGKVYVYASKIKTNLDIEVFKADFVSQEGNADQLQEIINNFIGNNQDEVYKTFKPALEEVISKKLLTTMNDVFKHFTFDELLPDRE